MTRVLVVDDAAFMRARSSKLLGEKGYEVVEAANGAEALEVYKGQRPDCVLLDITMPKMDGIVTLQEIMKMDPTARVAMVTAMGQKSMVMNRSVCRNNIHRFRVELPEDFYILCVIGM